MTANEDWHRSQIDGAGLVGIERCGQSGCGGKHESVAVVGLSFLCPWENAGIFTDYGLTGTDASRPGFQNLIPDLKDIKAMLMDTIQLERQLAEAQAELDVAAGLINSYFNGKPITEDGVASGRFEAMQERYNTAKLKTDSLTNQINDLKNRHQRMQRFISKVEKLDTPFDTFSSEMWLGLADHVTVILSLL